MLKPGYQTTSQSAGTLSPGQASRHLLLRTVGLALAASGFVVAIWESTNDYPNGFLTFPVGLSLVLLTLSPDDKALTTVVHVWCAALVVTTQLSHVMFLAPSSWRLATAHEDGSFKQIAHIVWIRFGPMALTAIGTFAAVIGLAAIASLSAFWPRVRRTFLLSDGTRHAWALLRGAHAAIAINVLVVRLYVILFYPEAPRLFETARWGEDEEAPGPRAASTLRPNASASSRGLPVLDALLTGPSPSVCDCLPSRFGPLFGFAVTPPLDVMTLSWCEVLTATLWLCLVAATTPHRRDALQARIRGSSKELQ